MSKKYIVSLMPEERLVLEQLTKKGKAAAYKVNHARILLKADTNTETGGWKDLAISKALDISIPTIERVRRLFVEQGIEAALSRQPTKKTKFHLLDGEQEAQRNCHCLQPTTRGTNPLDIASFSRTYGATRDSARAFPMKLLDKH